MSRIAALIAAMAVVAGPAAAQSLTERFGRHDPAATRSVDHSAWTRLLSTYVVPGPDGINRVAYAKFKAEGHAALKSYIAALQSENPATLTRPEQFAFWANLYNAKTIDIVLDKYPVKSIKDISLGGGLLATVTGGPWKAKVTEAGGTALSLDDIEHAILRPVFKDPRVHYAVNCASIGCPNLMTEAFTGGSLERQLDAAATAYVNHPRAVRVDEGAVTVSSIYSWFAGDFGGSDADVLAHVRKYARAELVQALDGTDEIADHAYDWSLNDVVN